MPDHPSSAAPSPNVVEGAIQAAERAGFRIAVAGRSAAVLIVAILNFWSFYFPTNVVVALLTLSVGMLGFLSLVAVGGRFEAKARYFLFACDASVITLLLAFAPLSSGGAVPQNLVFVTSWMQLYYLIIAAAILTLSPALVVWTGAWAAGGLIFATLWIMSGMDRILSYGDLPSGPTPDVYIRIVLDPNFLGIASRVEEVLAIALVTAMASFAVRQARKVIRDLARAEAGRQRVQSLFERYVPPSVMRELLDEGHLVPQTRDATLLFADIEGFSSITEGMDPGRLMTFVNDVFTGLTDIVDRQGGVVVSYIGDAIMASFNAPLAAEDHAARAVVASGEILRLVSSRSFLGVTVRIRIGIATGRIAAGTVGSGERQAYTLYGRAVNLSQRLEELNKQHGTSCLVCGVTAHQARAKGLPLRSLGSMTIRNFSGMEEIFEPTNG